MGKAAKPLMIGVDSRLAGQPWLLELEAKGHLITLKELAAYDRVLGPNCCCFRPGMEEFLDVIIKGARVEKYPKVKKDDQA